jgi:AAA+ ATPase superfamily predicted ATPase
MSQASQTKLGRMREMVDREGEQRDLLAATERPPALVVMIGRRRVGKSFLLERTLTGTRVIFFQGDEQDERHHLDLFAAEASRVLIGTEALYFATWDAAFELLASQARQQPLTVVLDEFQWLKRAQPAIDSIIQRYWDRWDREQLPITLVLAGSALTLMEQLLEKGSPLYGRATARPWVLPLDYRQAAGFARTGDPEQLLRRWAVLGGTPQYQVWAGDGHLERIVAERVLAKDAPLYDEPRHLLREGEGIRDPGTYVSIMRAIAGGATRYNEIAQQSRTPSNMLSSKLARLEDLGYVERRYPVEPDGRQDRVGYQVSDPFFRFWFRYVAGNRSRLERGHVSDVLREIMVDIDNIMGWAFEQCCRRWTGVYADQATMGRPTEVGAWWSRDGRAEVDVVGTAGHHFVLLGSCEWRRLVDVDVLDQLRDHQAFLGGRAAAARLVLFARAGFTTVLRRQAADEGVLLVTAADLFATL